MARGGVFAVSRGIWDDADFANEPFTEREAFLWLVGEAAWRRTRTRVGSAAIDLQRGQCAFSTRFMATRWKWSEAKVRRFLTRMKKCKIIDAVADARATLVTICKYDRFQKVGLPSDAPDDAEATQERRTPDAPATQERRKEETGKHGNIEGYAEPAQGRETPLTHDIIEAKLREAAGATGNPSAALCDASPILGLMDAGFDLDGDILPVIRSKPRPHLKSWAYYVEPIREAKARRSAVATAPTLVIDNSSPPQRAPPRREPKPNVGFDLAMNYLGELDANAR